MKNLIWIFFTQWVTAEVIDITLNLTPPNALTNTLDLTLEVPVLGNSSDTTEVSGSILARIDIDPETGLISSLELLSGDLSGTPVNFSNSVLLLGSYDLSTSVLGGTVDTLAPPAPVIAQQTAAELHQLIINSGTLTGSATALGTTTPVGLDFSTTPVLGTGPVGDFAVIASIPNPLASTDTSAVFDLIFSYPIELTQEVDIGISVSVFANGNVNALGQVSLPIEPPNPYLIWAATNGIPEAPFTENDFSTLLPSGLFWALGYNAGDNPAILCPDNNPPGTFTLNLPQNGTVAEVAVQRNLDLSNPNSWITIATIPVGATETQGPFGNGGNEPTLLESEPALLESEPAFLRLQVPDPAREQ